MLKTGFGYDLHKLTAGRKLWIGGVDMPSEQGSVAHSDGDALIHAIIDSLLSPLNAGDIGSLFPDTDPAYKDISSLKLLIYVKDHFIKDAVINNIDCVVVLDRPKILPHIPAMKAYIAKVLDISENQIGIKGKTTENTRPDCYESYAVCLIEIK